MRKDHCNFHIQLRERERERDKRVYTDASEKLEGLKYNPTSQFVPQI